MVLQGLLLVCLSMTPQQAAQTAPQRNMQVEPDGQEQNIRAYVELLRANLKTQKVAIITEVMNLNDKDAAVFWPIYREYDLELSKLGDEKLAIIQDYAQNYLTMTNEKADQLAKRVLELDDQRQELRRKYYDKFKDALSPLLAARFTQVENQIEMIVDLQIASSLPIIEEAPAK
jgi:CHAT domain-containing protein